MKRFTQLGVCLSLLLLAMVFSMPAAARGRAVKNSHQSNKNNKPPANEGKNKNPNPPNGNNAPKGNQPGNGRGGANLPPKFVEKMQDMSPDQQEKFMQNNERFRNMSPQQQAQIRQRLQHWNSLSPEQRVMWRQREAALEQMTPQERQFVQQQVQPAWRDMSPEQRRPMLLHLRQLYGMSAPEAQAKLSDPAFMQGISPDQQRMLPYLYRLRVGAAPEPPPGPPESL
jgi:hypothetical protein